MTFNDLYHLLLIEKINSFNSRHAIINAIDKDAKAKVLPGSLGNIPSPKNVKDRKNTTTFNTLDNLGIRTSPRL